MITKSHHHAEEFTVIRTCKEAGSGIKDNGRQGEERQTDPTVDFSPNTVLCDAVSE